MNAAVPTRGAAHGLVALLIVVTLLGSLPLVGRTTPLFDVSLTLPNVPVAGVATAVGDELVDAGAAVVHQADRVVRGLSSALARFRTGGPERPEPPRRKSPGAKAAGVAATAGAGAVVFAGGTPAAAAQQSGATATLLLDPAAVTTFAGSGTDAHVDANGTAAAFKDMGGVVEVGGLLYVSSGTTIRTVDVATGAVTTLAGSPTTSGCTNSSDPTLVRFGGIGDLTSDGTHLYLADINCNYVVRKVSIATGATTTLGSTERFYSANLTIGPDDFLYVAAGQTVRKMDTSTGTATSFASLGGDAYGGAAGLTSDADYLWVLKRYATEFSNRYQVLRIALSTAAVTQVVDTSVSDFVDTDITSAGDYFYVGGIAATDVRRYRKSDMAMARIAGTNAAGYADGTDTDAWFGRVADLVSDGSSVWVADAPNRRLRKLVDGPSLPSAQSSLATTTVTMAPGTVSTFAGSGTVATTDAIGTAAAFKDMGGIVTVGGAAYVLTAGAIRKVDLSTAQVMTFAGHATATGTVDSTDPTAARFHATSYGITTNGHYLYVADGGGLRRISLANGATSTVLTGTTGPLTFGPDGKLYVGVGRDIRRIDPASGTSTVFATPADTISAVKAVTADANAVYALVLRSSTTPTVQLKRVDLATSAVTQLADPAAGPNYLAQPLSIASAGDYLYTSGAGMPQVRRFAKAGGPWIDVAGTSGSGYADATSADAWFGSVAGIATDGVNLWVADSVNHRVRKVVTGSALPKAQPKGPTLDQALDPTLVGTFAGNGANATVDGPIASASFKDMEGVALAGTDAYVSTPGTIRKVDLVNGVVTSFAGDGTTGGSTDSTNPAAVRFACAGRLATDGYFLYQACSSIRRISLATGATSTLPVWGKDVAVGPDGYLYVAQGKDVLRVNTTTGQSTLVATVGTETNIPAINALAVDDQYAWVAYSFDTSVFPRFQIKKVRLSDGQVTLFADHQRKGTTLVSAGAYLYYGNTGFDDISVVYTGDFSIRRYAKATGTWVDAAGAGTSGYVDGLGADARFGNLRAMISDGTNVWLADSGNKRLRVATSDPRLPIPGDIAFGDDGYGPWTEDVNGAIGNFVRTTTDLTIAGIGPDLAVTRTYNSRETRSGPFGVGWSFPYGTRWDYMGEGVVISYPDGRQEYHPRRPDGTYATPTGYYSTLTPTTGGAFTLTAKDRTVHAFRPDGKLSSITDANGHRTDLAYDAGGKLSTVTDATSARSLTFTWSGSYVASVATQPVAAHGGALTWKYYYSGNKLVQACDPRNNAMGGSCTVYTWTGDRITKITRPRLNVDVELGYLADGRVDWRRNGAGDDIDFSYPSAGVVRSTDERGNTTESTYDSLHRQVSETDAALKVVTHAYDARGNRTSTTDGNLTTTSFGYDSRGNVVSSTDGEGKTTFFTYDANDLLLTKRDPRSSGPTDPTYVTTYTYDAAGNRTGETSPPTADFPSGVTRSATYTTGAEAAVGGGSMPPGLLRTETDERGRVTTHSYNSLGDRVETLDPVGLRTVWTYDEVGRKLTETVHSDVYPAGVTTTTTYDMVDNVLTVTGPLTTDPITGAGSRTKTTNVYDANENLEESRVEDTELVGSVRTTSFDYDDADRQISVDGAEPGTTTTRRYDVAGNVDRVTDAEGRVIDTAYDARNLPTTVTLRDFVDDPVAGTTPRDMVLSTATYDAARRKVTEVDALGRTRRFAYDKVDRLKSVTLEAFDNRDATTRDIVLQAAGYDPAGHVLTEESGGGKRKLAHTYDAAGRRTGTTLDPGGLDRVTTFAYNQAGNVVRRTTTGGGRTEETRFQYDDGGRRTHEEVENGAVDLVAVSAYDDRDNVLSTTSPEGHTTDFVHDELSRLVKRTLPTVTVEEGGTGAVAGRPEWRTGYSAFGEVVRERDPRSAVTTTAYDRLGRKTLVTYPAYTNPDGATLTPTESFSYDDVGNLVSSTNRRGKTSDFTFDKRNRVVRQLDPLVTGAAARGEVRTVYDDAGNRTRRVDQRGAATEWTYDDLDRVRTETAVVRVATGGPLHHVTTFDYDDLGNKVYERDPLGHETRFEWSPASEQTKEIDALLEEDRYSYDVAGRRVEAIDPLGRKTTTEYDLAGRAVAERRYDVGGTLLITQQFGWDKDGRRIAVTTPRGKTTTFGWDAAGRLTSVVEPVSATHSITTGYGYDAAGNLTRLTDGKGHTTRRTYTAWNLPESTIEPSTTAHPALADRTWTTLHDAGGLPVEERQPGGVTVTRVFDELGRVTGESGSGGGAVAASRTFAWDLAGLRTSVSHPAGTIGFEYDDRRLMTAATGGAGSSSFAWDAAGRMTSRTDAAGTATFGWTARDELATAADPLTGTVRAYGWDDASQLVSVGHGTGNATRSLTWDGLGRLASDTLRNGAGAQQVRHAYGYDDDGNLTSQAVAVPPLTPLPGSPPSNPAAGTHLYRYDDAGRLAGWTQPSGADTAYAWDDAGNRVAAGSEAFAYDERNRLVSGPDGVHAWTPRGTLASRSTGPLATSTWTFDSLGRVAPHDGVAYAWDGLDRLAVRTAGTAAAFLYAGAELDPVSDGAATWARSPSGDPLALSDASGAALVGRNRHGDVSHLFSASGAVSATRVWDPFGEAAGSGGATTLPMGYQGDWTDPLSGEVWMGARWYRPSAAGFDSRDSVAGVSERPVTLNRYTYANGDPLEFFDPDGHFGIPVGGLFRSLGRSLGLPDRRVDVVGGAGRSATSAAGRTAGIQARRSQQRILPGVGLPAPDGWDRWSGKQKKDWIAKHDPVVKNMKLANPWDVKERLTDAYRGAENGVRGIVDGATNTVTMGRGTKLGPRHKGDIYQASYGVGRAGGSAAVLIGAGGAVTARAAGTAVFRGVASKVGGRVASSALGGLVGAASEKVANPRAGAKQVLLGGLLGAAGGLLGGGGRAPEPVAPQTADDLAQAAAARDAAGQQLGRKHATYVGGTKDGSVVVGCSNNPVGCAEDDVARQLGPDAQMTKAFGWRRNPTTGELEWTEIPVCTRCQEKYGPHQFPPDVQGDPSGAWGRR